jgi:hypothetical protein
VKAYIDFQSFAEREAVGWGRYDLNPEELQQIGEFTRENISKWLDSSECTLRGDTLPIGDFYAVCGDIVVPWKSNGSERAWEELNPNKKHTEGPG